MENSPLGKARSLIHYIYSLTLVCPKKVDGTFPNGDAMENEEASFLRLAVHMSLHLAYHLNQTSGKICDFCGDGGSLLECNYCPSSCCYKFEPTSGTETEDMQACIVLPMSVDIDAFVFTCPSCYSCSIAPGAPLVSTDVPPVVDFNQQPT